MACRSPSPDVGPLVCAMVYRLERFSTRMAVSEDKMKELSETEIGRADQFANEVSSQRGVDFACPAISSRISWRGVIGLQFQTMSALPLDRTTQGRSKALGVESLPMECLPKRSSHQAVSWAREQAESKPPLTLIRRGLDLSPA